MDFARSVALGTVVRTVVFALMGAALIGGGFWYRAKRGLAWWLLCVLGLPLLVIALGSASNMLQVGTLAVAFGPVPANASDIAVERLRLAAAAQQMPAFLRVTVGPLSTQQTEGTFWSVVGGLVLAGMGLWMARQPDRFAAWSKQSPGVFGTTIPGWFFRAFGVFAILAGSVIVCFSVGWVIWFVGRT